MDTTNFMPNATMNLIATSAAIAQPECETYSATGAELEPPYLAFLLFSLMAIVMFLS